MKLVSSLQNPLVKKVRLLQESVRARREENLVVVEGKKTLQELTAKRPARMLFTLDPEIDYPAEESYQITEQVLKKMTDVPSPEGVLALLERPKEETLRGEKILALDRIGDPGNLGTLIRTAFAFGFDGIYLLDGTSDPFSPKALRAAKGASFYLPYATGDEGAFLKWAKEYTLIAASMEGSSLEKIEGPVCLILGSEHHGVSPALKSKSRLVSIPMRPDAESLNVAVAGGILMSRL
ncbi:MAG: RNA methyltransferase, partial [Chlamydiia bacterium]|nr:RNA methyltransferase [Chlamydiia bacterium]